MTDSVLTHITSTHHRLHTLALDVIDAIPDEHLAWSPNPGTPSIGWHFWHLARSVDVFHAIYLSIATGMPTWQSPGQQVWAREQLAHRWGLDPATLGWEEMGTDMSPEAAATVSLPSKQDLLAYARQSFTAFEQAVEQYHDQATLERSIAGLDAPITAGWLLLHELQHTGRHLGMIEALRGAAGTSGTATG